MAAERAGLPVRVAVMPVIATTKPITGRTMTLPAGTRLVGAYRLADGRWVCQWNGRRLVVHGAPVVVGQRDETGRET